ncbi:MAG TPA: AAA family ATPase [Gammaproteobacteria bacterium]
MYEVFFGLKEKPFSLLPDPEYLYLSPKHQRALILLEYGMMNQAGFSVICGDTGAGKTTLIRRLLNELGEETTVGLITNTHRSFGELLNWVLLAFGLDGEGKSKSQMHQMLIEFLIEQYARNRQTVLIVDEAQNMSADTLEELRMLSNINADKDQVLQVILAGQPALRETLRKPELMQFAQRIAVDYYLESLNRDETREYINHRLHIAGADHEIFTPEACYTIYKYSGGIPRLINLLCDTSLVYGFAEQTKIINASLVEDVVREQHRHSTIKTYHGMDDQEQSRKESIEASADEQISQQTLNDVVTEEKAQHARQHADQEYDLGLTEVKHEQHVVRGYAAKPAVIKTEVRHDKDEKDALEKASAKAKVTPIKQDMANDKHVVEESSKTSDKQQQETVKEQPVSVEQKETRDTNEKESVAAHHDSHAEFEPVSERYGRRKHDDYEEMYPIIHVEENQRGNNNVNMLVLGVAAGMFITTIILAVSGYMIFGKQMTLNQTEVQQVLPKVSEQSLQQQQQMDQASLEAAQKERDAAVAMMKAIERERDAAKMEAKAQEEMRAAEKRAAEIIAEQERKIAQQVEIARKRALEAEVAAAKAVERERLAQQEAYRIRVEAESRAAEMAQKLLQKEQELIKPNVDGAVPKPARKAAEMVEEEPVFSKETADKGAKAEDDTAFSANPCNSASAKFLSTCKK